jgi:O-antigen/teichoic acid export membrane protein
MLFVRWRLPAGEVAGRPVADDGVAAYLAGLESVGAAATVRLVAALLNAVCAVAFVAVAVRLLGTSSYGLIAYFVSIVVLVTGLSRAGWGTATTHAVAAAEGEPERRRVGRAAMMLSIAASVLGVAVILAMIPSGTHGLDPGSRVLLVAGLVALLVGMNAATAASSVARGLGRAVESETPQLLIAVVRLLVLVAIAATGSRSVGSVSMALAAAGLAGVACSAAIARRYVQTDIRERAAPDTARIGLLLRASVPFVMQGLAIMAIARFDVVVLGLTAARASVGQYEGTLRVTERLVQLVPFVLSAQYLPVATALWRDGRRDAFGQLYRTMTGASYWATFPIVVALASFPEPLLHLLYGNDFPVRPELVWVLLAGFLPQAVLATSWTALASTGERRALVRVSALTFVVMLVSAVVLIPWMGPMGAAAATSISLISQQAVAAVALHRHTGVHLVDRSLRSVVARSVLLFLAALGLRAWVLHWSSWWAAAAVVVVSVVWLASVWRIEGIGPARLLSLARARRPTHA